MRNNDFVFKGTKGTNGEQGAPIPFGWARLFGCITARDEETFYFFYDGGKINKRHTNLLWKLVSGVARVGATKPQSSRRRSGDE